MPVSAISLTSPARAGPGGAGASWAGPEAVAKGSQSMANTAAAANPPSTGAQRRGDHRIRA